MAKRKSTKKNIRVSNVKPRLSFEKLWRRLQLTVVGLLSISIAAGCIFLVSQYVQYMLEKPITSVLVKGHFNYLPKSKVIESINAEIDSGFIVENLEAMRHKLETNPWIDRVDLRRQWPDSLQVTITEERPIARWGEQGFVNYRGEIVEVETQEILLGLPQLLGDTEKAYTVMRQYQLLSQLLEKSGYKILRLEQNPLGSWRLNLDNGWELIAGRNQVLKKVQRLMVLLEQNKITDQKSIAVIDMRYENGLAVRWLDEEQHAIRQPVSDRSKI